jgi:hypothetical protein
MTANIFSVLRMFSGHQLFEELNGEHINRLSNVLTLRSDIHEMFGKMFFYFEEVEASFTFFALFSSQSLSKHHL